MSTVVRLSLLLFAVTSVAQDSTSGQLTIITKEVPPASLWAVYQPEHRYGFNLQAQGGLGPQHWRIISGSLPPGMKLEESGMITGTPEDAGQFEFTVRVNDNTQSAQQKLTLLIEKPLPIDWDRVAHVNGQRIDGSVKVSNQTGREIDVTFIVLAVNDIGRATAIGYQHFKLKEETRNLKLPFGDTLSPGNYTVHVDVVGEEPVSNKIFRARLVSGNQSITQGP